MVLALSIGHNYNSNKILTTKFVILVISLIKNREKKKPVPINNIKNNLLVQRLLMKIIQKLGKDHGTNIKKKFLEKLKSYH